MKSCCMVTPLLLATCLAPIAHGQESAERPIAEPPRPAPRDPPRGRDDSSRELTARKLFLGGRRLIKEGKPQEACTLLEEANRLSRTLGTLLNLGLCHQHSGRLATAHDYFRQAEVEATLSGDAERREFAHEEAAEISAQRATLTLRLPERSGSELVVEIDGVERASEVYEKPLFMDAGDHRISVRAGSGQTWHGSVNVVDGGKHVVVIPDLGEREVPAPAPKLDATSTPIVPPSPATTSAAVLRDTPEDTGPATQRVVGLTLGGVGIASLGVSVVYTVLAVRASDDSDSESLCKRSNRCTEEGIRLRDEALSHATRATVFGIAGAAALAGGAALWLLAPSTTVERDAPRVRFRVQPGLVSAELKGAL